MVSLYGLGVRTVLRHAALWAACLAFCAQGAWGATIDLSGGTLTVALAAGDQVQVQNPAGEDLRFNLTSGTVTAVTGGAGALGFTVANPSTGTLTSAITISITGPGGSAETVDVQNNFLSTFLQASRLTINLGSDSGDNLTVSGTWILDSIPGGAGFTATGIDNATFTGTLSTSTASVALTAGGDITLNSGGNPSIVAGNAGGTISLTATGNISGTDATPDLNFLRDNVSLSAASIGGSGQVILGSTGSAGHTLTLNNTGTGDVDVVVQGTQFSQVNLTLANNNSDADVAFPGGDVIDINGGSSSTVNTVVLTSGNRGLSYQLNGPSTGVTVNNVDAGSGPVSIVNNTGNSTTVSNGGGGIVASSGAITLSGVAVNVDDPLSTTGTVMLTGTAAQVAISDDVSAGTLTISASSNVTQTAGTIAATGTTTVSAGSGSNINLTQTGNNFGTLAVTSGNTLDIFDTNGITLNTISVSGVYTITASGTININGAVTGAGGSTVNGGSGADDFALGTGGSVSGTVDGKGGSNSLTGPNAATAWSISGSNSGALTGVAAFANIQALTGGSLADAFTVSSSGHVTSVAGGSGSNTLTGNNLANTWSVTAGNGGTLADSNGTIGFSAIQNLTGGNTTDGFAFANGTSIGGKLDGGAGSDTLDLSAFASVVLAVTGAGTVDGSKGTVTTILGNGFDNLNVLPPVFTSALTDSGTRGQSYSYQIVATGSPSAFNATSLPTGLGVDTGTGAISGAPTQEGLFNVTLSATNALGTNTATLALTVDPSADIAITKTDGVTIAQAGASVTYTITVSNAGPSADPSVSVADTLPGVLTATWTSVAAGGATGNTASGSGNISETINMPAGSSVTYTVSAAVDSAAAGSLSNTATATASVSDPTPGNNSATDTDTLVGLTDLSILKTVVDNGSTLEYTLFVVNNGPGDATGVTVTDVLPAEVAYISDDSGIGPPAGSTLTWNIGSLANGANDTAVVTVAVVPGLNFGIFNTASVAGSETDPVPGNDASTAIVVQNDRIDSDGDGIPDYKDPDRDGDGVNNDLDTAPLDPGTSGPLGQTGIPGLTVKKLKVRLNFATAGKNKITASGVFPVNPGFVSTSAVVDADVGGVARSFTLNNKGRGENGDDFFKLKVKARPNANGTFNGAWRLVIKNGTFGVLDVFSAALDGSSPGVADRILETNLTIGGATPSTRYNVGTCVYTSTAEKGTAKLKKL